METLIALLVFCLVVGVALWLIGLLPLPSPFGMIARVVIVIIALVYLLERFSGFGLG